MTAPVEASLLYCSAVVFFAATAHGLTGFGSALIAMPLLLLRLDIGTAAPLVALLTLTVNVAFLFRFRAALDPGRIVHLLAGSVVGIPAGILFLRRGDPRLLEIVLGMILVAYALHALFGGRGVPKVRGRGAFLLGTVSGFLGGAINTAGPPAVVYAASQSWSKEEIHVTLQLYFILAGLIIAAGHFLSGLTTGAVIRQYTVLVPALLTGCDVGYALHTKVSQDLYRRLVYVLLAGLGILLLVR